MDQRYVVGAAPASPIVLQSPGDSYRDPCRIQAIIWVGGTTAGDECLVQCPVTLRRLWRGRASSANTYMGVDFSDRGIAAPHGFQLMEQDAGTGAEVYIYLSTS